MGLNLLLRQTILCHDLVLNSAVDRGARDIHVTRNEQFQPNQSEETKRATPNYHIRLSHRCGGRCRTGLQVTPGLILSLSTTV